MLEIRVQTTGEDDREYSYDKNSVMIGRASGNDIALEKGGVSRYHAQISVENGKISIQDLDSTNGTFVNSERVQSQQIGPKDQISIGENVLTVEYRENDDVSADESEPVVEHVFDYGTSGDTASPASVSVEAVEAKPKKGGTSDDFYWQSLSSFLKPVWDFQLDDSVSEIMINGPDEIYVESKGKLVKTDRRFTPSELHAAVLNIAQYVGRRVSEEEPYVDARLPDGSRVAILMPPCSRKGTSIAIRKFAAETLTMEKLLGYGSLTNEMAVFMDACVKLKKNIIISGGTSSGKTSLLNVVSSLIPGDERIITIEDSAELQLQQEHIVPWETKSPDKKGRGQVTIRDLVKASLRMRPDRIVVGEIRGGEALDLLQAMNTGHSGSKATVHASSPAQALTRLETLSLFSGLEIPLRALREQVSTAIDVIIQASRLPDHSRKVVYISEVGRLTEDGQYTTNDIFKFQREGMVDGKLKGSHVLTGNLPSFIDEMEIGGFTDALALFDEFRK